MRPENLRIILDWCFNHWAVVTSVLAGVAALFRICFAWLKKRRETKLDRRVHEALQNPHLERSSKGFTGAGDPLTRSEEIAESLSVSQDKVVDSLERLEMMGKARNAGGTLDNPSPCWHVLHQ